MIVFFFGLLTKFIQTAIEESGVSKVFHIDENIKPPANIEQLYNISETMKSVQSEIIVISFWYPFKIPDYGFKYSVNIHPTILPYGRGKWPIPALLKYNRDCAGVTLHKMTSDFDAGDIIAQRRVFLSPTDDQDMYLIKIIVPIASLIKEFIRDRSNLWNSAKAQGHYITCHDTVNTVVHLCMGAKRIWEVVSCNSRGETALSYNGSLIAIDFVKISLFGTKKPEAGYKVIDIIDNKHLISFELYDGIVIFYKFGVRPSIAYG